MQSCSSREQQSLTISGGMQSIFTHRNIGLDPSIVLATQEMLVWDTTVVVVCAVELGAEVDPEWYRQQVSKRFIMKLCEQLGLVAHHTREIAA